MMKTSKAAVRGGRRSRLERVAMTLTGSCPVDGTNPANCPLCGLRPLAERERRAWVRGLSLVELEYLSSYHSCCQAEKKRVLEIRRKRR